MMSEVESLSADAEKVVNEFIARHRAGAIPALIGQCVMWSIMHGGHDAVRGSLERAIKMADEMQTAFLKEMQ